MGVSMTIDDTQANSTLRTVAYPDRNNENITPLLDMFAVAGHCKYTGDMGSNHDLDQGPWAVECLLELCIRIKLRQCTTALCMSTHRSLHAPFNVGPGSRIVGPESGKGPVSVVYSQSQDRQNILFPAEDIMKALCFYLNHLFTGSVKQFNSASPHANWPDDLTQAMFA